jgi:hypothetical protein
MMDAIPRPRPVTWGSVAGVWKPAAMNTVCGVTVSFEGSLLIKVTFIGAGAGEGKFTDSGAVWPSPTTPNESRVILPASLTVTFAVVSVRLGSALAWITAEPVPTPFTGTVTLVALATKVTLAGTVAVVVSEEVKAIVKPLLGAGPERFSVRFCVAFPSIVRFCVEKLSDAVTRTG